MKTESTTESVHVWTRASCDDNLWTTHAQRATVMIEAGEYEALAILIDDRASPRYYRVANHRIASFIASATQAWSDAGRGASLAVVWSDRVSYAAKGSWPPPPPPPIKDELLQAVTTAGHHQMLAAVEPAVRGAVRALRVDERAAVDRPGAIKDHA